MNNNNIGFSFTDSEEGYVNTGQETAPLMYEFLQQFYELFPELQLNDFYTTGVSFGGLIHLNHVISRSIFCYAHFWLIAIYGTSLAHLIHEKNSDTSNPPKITIPLKGLILDSPWFHVIDQLEFTTTLFGYGLIDEPTKVEMQSRQEHLRELLQIGNTIDAFLVHLRLDLFL